MIDYVVGDEKVKERIERMEVGEKVDSDNNPMIITVEGGEGGRKRGIDRKRREWRGIWDEEGIRGFREELGVVGKGEEGVQVEW